MSKIKTIMELDGVEAALKFAQPESTEEKSAHKADYFEFISGISFSEHSEGLGKVIFLSGNKENILFEVELEALEDGTLGASVNGNYYNINPTNPTTNHQMLFVNACYKFYLEGAE